MKKNKKKNNKEIELADYYLIVTRNILEVAYQKQVKRKLWS